ncbi:MAG: hypothetical protein ACI8XO_002319 [Verrucomicrobiales bacterium]|jgi:hypothetical protein
MPDGITIWMLKIGWVGMLLGVVSGVIIGMFFHCDDWMGGVLVGILFTSTGWSS